MDRPPLAITREDISLSRDGDRIKARYSGALIISPAIADAMRALNGGELPPGVIVTVQPPAHWPLGKPWPPKVTVAAPCWRCVATPLPGPLDHIRILAR